MPLSFRDGYSTVSTTNRFETTAGQFGSDLDRLEYSHFFGLGGGADDPFRVPFDLPLSLSATLPFVGEAELFSARLFGELAATFGLQVTAAANNGRPDPDDPGATPTGTITATLPYQLAYSFPTLDPAGDAAEIITLRLGNSFAADDDAGFTTLFPRLEFTLELVAELAADIAAEVGRGEAIEGFTILDFEAGTSYELFSLDTGRRDAEGERDPINALGGTTTQEIIDDIGWLDPVYDREGAFAGVEIPFNQFFSQPETRDKEKAEAEVVGQTGPDDADAGDRAPPNPAGLDLGALQILVPNINATSEYVDGVFVTDPTRRVVDGEIIDDVDADGFAQARGNRGDIAVLTIDVDGLLTYATGGSFPPLEFQFEQIEASIADVLTLTADFYYNLFDVELVAALPLVQEFTLTPELGTRLSFFEVNADGSKGAAKPVEVVQLEQVLLFDEHGSFQSQAVADRLAELAETSTLRVAQDVAQFVDVAAGIPGAFTGQTASIGGRVVVREDGGEWRELFSNADDPIARSAPALGQDQLEPLELSGLEFGYKIFRDDIALGDFEIIAFDFDEAASIFRLETRETVAPLAVTPYLTDFDALNLRHDGADTFVEVEHRAQPFVTNRTGLEFDLELVLSAMEFHAEFGAFVDLGFTELGGTIAFDIGPLWRERFPLFEASLVDFYNDQFQVFDDENSHIESFILGAAAPAPDYGDAIVGTEGDDVLEAPPEGSTIIMLGGDDTVIGGPGDDTIFMGMGRNTVDGGGGHDTLDLGMLATPLIVSGPATGARAGASYSLYTFPGLPDWAQHAISPRDETLSLIDRHPLDVHIRGIERVLMTEANDRVAIHVVGTEPDFGVPELIDLRGGDNFAEFTFGLAALEARGLTVRSGAGDDTIGVFVTEAETDDWSNFIINGGGGVNTLRVDADFDLSKPVGQQGALGAMITGFTHLTADRSFAQTFVPEGQGGSYAQTPINYLLVGDDRDNRIEGAMFDDTLSGGSGNNVLIGGGGDNLFIGGPGADEMIGGEGNDTVSYADASTSIFIDLDFHGDGIGRGFRGDAQGDALRDIENVIGSGHDDILIGAPGVANRLEGNGGNNRLMAKGYNDTLIGGDGDDLLAAGGPITRNTAMNNTYDGGEGFDILALQTFAPQTITGTLTGTATYSYLTGSTFSSETSTTTRNVTVDYRYERTGHVKVTLGEDGSGIVEYWQDDASGRVQATGLSGSARYSAAEPTWVGDLWPAYTNKNSSFDYNIAPVTLDRLFGRSISFSKSGTNNNGSGEITSTTSAPAASAGGLYATEEFFNIEGLIGTAGDDVLVGNSHANALYGNGGWDLVAGGGDGNLLGFGEGQKIADIFSFPGSAFRTPTTYPTLEQRLVSYDPYGTMDGDLDIPVGRIRIGTSAQTDNTQVVGSMLWGQGQDNTLDMRFDRGISFLPDRSDNYAVVDLDVASADAPTNNFTGEAVMYGRAEWRDEGGTLLTHATTFGVHNVIGSQMADTIRGDRADNVIEGMGGGDWMDGRGGTNTLAYGRAPEGVTLNMLADGDEGLILDNRRDGFEGAGHARGDYAVNFQRFTLSDHGDAVLIDTAIPVRTVTLSFGDGARSAILPVAELPDNDPLAFYLGAGDDHLSVVGGPRIRADLGEGDDTARVAGPGHTILGGAGDDVITIIDPGQASLAAFDAAQRTTVIDGGDGSDTVVLEGDRFTRITLTETGTIVAQNPLTELDGDATAAEKAAYIDGVNASPPILYDLRNIAFLEVGGDRFRLDPLAPEVGADRTLTILEDAREPFTLDARATQPELDTGTLFRVVALPLGAEILRPDGTSLEVGDSFAAADLAALLAVPGQDYTQASQSFVYAEAAADAPERTVPLPAAPPVPGIALGLGAPTDPLGADLGITVTELPDHGTVFHRAPLPEFLDLGITLLVEVPVDIGDTLTPEQLAGLYYQPEQDANGLAGAFAYTASHGEGLGGLSGLPVEFADGRDPAAHAGTTSQRIEIDITPVDDAPRISRLLFPMSPGGTLEGTIAASDPEGDPFTLELVEAPGRGSLDLAADGSFRYRQTTEIDFAGAEFVEEVFTVRAVQADGLASVARPQTIRIINPEVLKPIVFDPSRPDVFFEEDGTPVKLGGLGTDDIIIGADGIDNELHGFAGNNLLRGIGGNNRLYGGTGNDTLEGGTGDDLLFGGGGYNTAVFSGNRADYLIDTDDDTGVTTVTDTRTIPDHDGSDRLEDIQRLRFADGDYLLDAEATPPEIVITVRLADFAGRPLGGVEVVLDRPGGEPVSDITDAAGRYAFEIDGSSGGQFQALRAYDAATDGRPGATDALEVLRMAVGLTPGFGPATPEAFIAADMNGDGQITAVDALEVLRAAVGLESANAPRWVFVDAEADLSGIDRQAVEYDTGVTVDALTRDIEVSMTGILIGSMQEFA